MKKSGLLIGGIIVGVLVLFTIATYNSLVRDEEGIKAQEKVIDLAIDKMVKKIEGQGFVVKDFKNTLKEVLGTTIGEGGRAAAGGKFFNAVSERYPEIPQAVWRDMGQTMNAEYESMYSAQTSKIARIQTFRTKLRNPVYLIAKIVGGFPTIDLEKAEQVIVGTKARDARQTGTIETVDPFQPDKK